MNTFDHTVHADLRQRGGVTRSTPAGTGITWPAGTTTRSAYPPPASSAQHLVADAPAGDALADARRSVPLHSSPSTSEAPGGGG